MLLWAKDQVHNNRVMDKARRETHHDEMEACYSLFYDTLNYYYCLLFCDDIVLPLLNTSNFL